MLDLNYLNEIRRKKGLKLFTKEDLVYLEIKDDGEYLIDENGNRIGTKGDFYHKKIIEKILTEGTWDENPRPKYADGQPAHTLSLNHGMTTYDLSNHESPLITLRPIATKSSIGELLWIYQDASNDLEMLVKKYGINWWNEWAIGDGTIGTVYGETVNRHNLMKNLLEGLEKDPDGRRHIISLWQEVDFKEKHGLKPCAFLTQFNVRHGRDGKDYLDMVLTQRSSDFLTAGSINQFQYTVLLHLVANHLGINPGNFSWQYNNIQIYDEHILQAIELLRRQPVALEEEPYVEITSENRDFYKIEQEDIQLKKYPRQLIKTKNPQLRFPIGI